MVKKKLTIKRKSVKHSDFYKKDLNEEQYQAVIHDQGPALVIAGAGSGKTRMLTYRVTYLIEQGINPQEIVLVTFTKKAAQEMTSRVNNLIGNRSRGMYAGTFHHLANRVLRKYAKTLGYNSNFTILDRSDSNSLMKIIRAANKPSDSKVRYPKPAQIVDMHSKSVNLRKPLSEILTSDFPGYSELGDQLEGMISVYQKQKKRNNQMDFDDLLTNFLKFLKDIEKSHAFKQKIHHVLVDEYQDINAVQAEIVYELSKDAESVTIVGDDAQSIYAFRGGDFMHIVNFPSQFPSVSKFKLVTNYRSTPEILDLANASIKNNQIQFEKELQTSRPSGTKPMMIPCKDIEQEAEIIAEQILQFREENIPFHEQAVLFRSRHHVIQLEQTLVQKNIPYDMRAGVRFFEQAHIKDLLAFLAVIVNPRDQIQWIRAFSLHPGISATSGQKIMEILQNDPHPLVKFSFAHLPTILQGKRVRKVGIDNLIQLQKLYRHLIMEPESKTQLPSDKLPRLPDLLDKFTQYLEPILKDIYEKNWEDRLRDMKELQNFAVKYHSIQEFLADILTQYNIRGERIKENQDSDVEQPLILSTIHQAKGLEWKAVYIINLVEGRLPHVRSIGNTKELEEERRLFYVAATRAKDYLVLTYPIFLWRRSFDDISGKSRFLTEIEKEQVYDEYEIEFE